MIRLAHSGVSENDGGFGGVPSGDFVGSPVSWGTAHAHIQKSQELRLLPSGPLNFTRRIVELQGSAFALVVRRSDI